MSDKENWYDVGYEHAEELQKQQEAQKTQGYVNRFWMSHKTGDDPLKPKNQKEVIFVGGIRKTDGTLTSEPFCIWEHNPKIGDRYAQFTCSKATGKCAFCDAGIKRYYAGFYTIIEMVEYDTKQSGKVRNPRRLMCAKTDSINMFRKKLGLRSSKSLIGAKFTVFRSGDKKASIGDQWEFMEDVNLDTVLDANGRPVSRDVFNYAEVLKPLSYEAQKAALGNYMPSAETTSTGDVETGVAY